LGQVLALIAVASLLAGCAVALASAPAYTVQPGDTLAEIASAHDTTVDRLVELNRGTYPSLATDPGAIETGWKLKVPSGGAGIQVTARKSPSLGTAPTAVPLDRDAFEMEVVRLVNEERTRAGLAPLQIEPGLMQFARERSEDMVARNYLDHRDPQTGETVAHRIQAAENVTKLLATTLLSDRNAQRACANWMNSEGHRANITKPDARKTGVGIALGANYVIVTQVFVR
jgi:uncharacterized protein YkwD